MGKYNYEKIDWSKFPSIEKRRDIENTNRYIMDVELTKNEHGEITTKKETALQDSTEKEGRTETEK